MGEIYKARDTRLDRTVAVKILPSRLAADPHFRKRFDREARTISQLDHPHICALYDVGVHDGTAYLVMQYLEGETVADRLEKGPLPLDGALRCAVEILDALAAAHRAGVTHRDLKPANIMLTKSGAKLLDFGIAKIRPPVVVAGTSGSVTVPEPTPLTAAGTIVGTLHYLSPEQLEGNEGDARSDIFAMGAVLYEMLTGKKAFEGKSPASVIAAILQRDLPPSNGHALAPPALDRLVRKCLAKDPDERWQTAKDLGDELRWVLQSATSGNLTNSDVARETTAGAPGRHQVDRRRKFIFRVTIGFSLSVLVTTGLLMRGTFTPADPSMGSTGGQAPPRMAQPQPSVAGSASTDPLPKLAAPTFVTARRALENLYQEEVVAPCRRRVQERYPFGGGSDMPQADFGEVFGYGGLYDKFFADNIDKLVDTTRRPLAWPPGFVEPSPSMLAQFERAERIRRMFFRPGSKTPELAFTVRLSTLDSSATRFSVNIDGQLVAVEPGAESERRVVWPGPEKRGIAFATFEDRLAAPDQAMRFEGPWAWLRLIDAATPSVQARAETDLVSVFAFQTTRHKALVTIDASNAANPFAAREWRQFKCDP